MGAPLILASASPRRQELLQQLGVAFETLPADIDETPSPGEAPRSYVGRMAREKAAAVSAQHPDRAVLAADTVVVVGDSVLGKPEDYPQAMAMLQCLGGQCHQVMTAVCLVHGRKLAESLVSTDVAFHDLTQSQIERYLATDEPWDKAGSYGIQGLAGAFVARIEGSYSNVVGLPLHETWVLLEGQDIDTALSPGHRGG